MHPSRLLLSLLLLLPLSATSSPPLHHSRFSKNRLHRRSSSAGAQEYIEVARPLSFDSLTPACTLPLLSHTFANTLNLPPTNTTYSPPPTCTWSNAVLHFSASSAGSQYDRIAGVWLAGVELLRTSTPQPTDDGIFWSFRKDVTRYASLLRKSNLTLSVMLENIVNDVYTGVYGVNITFLYYDVARNRAVDNPSSLQLQSSESKLKESKLSVDLSKSLELNDNPADLILPISAAGDEGFWFKIQRQSDEFHQGIQIPLNTYRAVIEVYVSFHGNDEFWYTNPPDYYIQANGLPTQRGHGVYRELLVKLDDDVIGSVIPFPVIFTGGFNPLFWQPVVSIGAFNLPSYEFDITPFLGMLLDGKVHNYGLGVAGAILCWLVDANLHLWLDDKAARVQAGLSKYSAPSSCVKRDFAFQQLEGKFEVVGEQEREFSGWVSCSAGNFTTNVWNKLKIVNTIKFKQNGTKKVVKQEVKVKNKVDVKLSNTVSSIDVEREYPLKIETTTLPGPEEDTDMVTTVIEHSLEEQKHVNGFESESRNSQVSHGWMSVRDHDVLSGAGRTRQRYQVKDSHGCYNHRVEAEGGAITSNTQNFLCAAAAAAAASSSS